MLLSENMDALQKILSTNHFLLKKQQEKNQRYKNNMIGTELRG